MDKTTERASNMIGRSRALWTVVAGGICILLLALLVNACKGHGGGGAAAPPKSQEVSLRLGWQPPWANQGQVVEMLKHTDVLARHGVRVEFKAFTYGGPMSE